MYWGWSMNCVKPWVYINSFRSESPWDCLCNVQKQLSASGGHLSWRCLCCRRRPGCDRTYCREEWGGHRESMSICLCSYCENSPPASIPPVYFFLSSHLSVILKPFGSISRSLPSFSLLYSAFNFLRLSPPPPSLSPAMTQTAPLADHQLLNMQTAALLPKPSTHFCIRETNTPSRRLRSYADPANHILWKIHLNLFLN